MKFTLTFVATALLCIGAHAQLRKCVSLSGQVTYSDVLCVQGSSSGSLANPVDNQLDHSAIRADLNKHRAKTVNDEARLSDLAAESHAQSLLQHGDGKGFKQPVAPTAADTASNVRDCIRDVERQPASQNVKAELIASCRTAGIVQLNTGQSADVVKNCVASVERTGASGNIKARQLAICHGGDVKPELHHRPFSARTLSSCDRRRCLGRRGHALQHQRAERRWQWRYPPIAQPMAAHLRRNRRISGAGQAIA